MEGSGYGASLSMGPLLGEPGGEGSSFAGGPVDYERLWRWASLFMGAQLGNLEWARLLGTLMAERGSGGGESLSMGAL
jgi:hypothetical protein